MCGAVLGAVGAVASLAGTAVSAMGQMQAAKAQARAAEYQAKWDQAQAVDAIERGQVEEQKVRNRNAQVLGRQRAVMAAGNLDLTSGSPLDILGDTAQIGELDALTTRNNAQREAESFRVDSELRKGEAKNYRTAGKFAAVGTALSGVGSFAEKWYKASSSFSTASA